jgi:hypothetical protein
MRQIDAVTTQVYTALEFYLLFLVGFGLARRKTWSLVPLGIVAVISGLWPPLVDAVTLVSPAVRNNIDNWFVQIGGYRIFPPTILDWMFLVVLVLNIALQQIRERRRQAEIEMEIKSAQEVQHILIPEEIPAIPGFSVASVYKPAAEVGGDFFQVIPQGEKGQETGALIVVGDVSGKGLKAAMTVSLIVGTLRTLAEYTRGPAPILLGLNRRLLGRTRGGFSTCLVLRIIDTEIHDTVLIAAAFCMYNRYVDGLATTLPLEEAFYLGRGKQVARDSYVAVSQTYLPAEPILR